MRRPTLLSTGALLVALLAIGCGPEGIPRYDLRGAVTYQGQPVPAGEISFRPDTSQGNSGPASFAVIHEGRYSTPPGNGVVGGAYIVEILGYDQPPAGEGMEGGTQLFNKHTLNLEFPEKDAEVDLVITQE